MFFKYKKTVVLSHIALLSIQQPPSVQIASISFSHIHLQQANTKAINISSSSQLTKPLRPHTLVSQPQDVVVLLIVRNKRLSLSVCLAAFFSIAHTTDHSARGIPFMELSCNRRNHCIRCVCVCMEWLIAFLLAMPLHEREKKCVDVEERNSG